MTEQKEPNIVDVMKQLAELTETTADAQKILDTYDSEDTREIWKTVWALITVQRLRKLRETDPEAPFPPEWRPLR